MKTDAFEMTLEDLSKDEKHFNEKERHLIHTILMTYRFFQITKMIDDILTNAEKKEDDDDE